MTDGQDEERLLMRDNPEGDAETPSSAKLKFDSFSMERGPGLRFDRSLDRRTGEVELPSRRRMQEYRNARKQADNAVKSTHGAAGNAVGNTARLAAFGGHTALSHDEDDSAAADAVHEGEYAAMYASDSGYSSKRKTHSSYSEPTLKEKADAVDSASKKIQKREIQKGYHSTGNKSGSSAAATGKKAAKERKAAKKAEEGTKDTAKAIGKFIKEHPMAALAMAGILFLIIVSASMCSTCTSFFAAGGGVVSATSISANEKDIRAVEEEYSRMEQELKDSFEKEKQGYEEKKQVVKWWGTKSGKPQKSSKIKGFGTRYCGSTDTGAPVNCRTDRNKVHLATPRDLHFLFWVRFVSPSEKTHSSEFLMSCP